MEALTKLQAHSIYVKACEKLKKIETSTAIAYEVAGGAIVRMRDFIAAERIIKNEEKQSYKKLQTLLNSK